ncbi:MAG: type II toxin-antitoxin system PemK/MazF family toxin [Mucilaginibacter sp.]|uniref:type II toxin-antitoxin system PemK/MazF family toxin n=1 Tax=Mucilaginibacter sp. TaxID=1882438 RepID=UPI0034E52A0B
MENLKRFDIWITDMNPPFGSEPGKVRPVVIVQSDVLHQFNYPATIVCPISSQQKGVSKIRIPVKSTETNGLKKDSSIIVDQITAIDLGRLRERVGYLEVEYRQTLYESIFEILDLANTD